MNALKLRLLTSLLLCLALACLGAATLGSLHDAARAGDADTVALLLRRGAEVDSRTEDTADTALTVAAQAGHLEIVRMLVAAGADLTATNNSEQDAVALAQAAGHTAVLAFLNSSIDSDREANKPVTVRMITSMGDIVIQLNREKAPISVKNFLAYVDEGFYEGTIFHRVISNFMIQGGGFTPDMQQKRTNPAIKNEWRNGLKNLRGAIAMARLGGQADSATSQFFINVKDNPALDQPRDGSAYAVFGKVIEGMDVVDAIKATPTGNVGRYGDVPLEPVIIKSIERLEEE